MSQPKAVAYIDEAGEKGLIRNLTPDRDDKIGLLGSLVFPMHRIDEFRGAFDRPFVQFKTEGGDRLEKLHVTEAFRPGNEDLRPMAEAVRREVFQLVISKQVPVLYCARRMRNLRAAYVHFQNVMAKAKSSRRAKHIAISDHPSDDRVEEDLMLGLTLRIDAFGIDYSLDRIDVATDKMDMPIAMRLNEKIEQTRSVTFSQKVVKAFNMNTRQPVAGTISFRIADPPFEMDTKHVGDLIVVGKDDSFVFATDVVVNSLNDHLLSLAPEAKLNAPTSIRGWGLESRVLGTDDNAFEDLLITVSSS